VGPRRRRRRIRRWFAASVIVLAIAAILPRSVPVVTTASSPNIIIILTDDQSLDTLPSDPPAMPWLQSQIFDRPGSGWRWFPNAILSTPLCCPSRATILTGRYAHHTGVQGNGDGEALDESQTLATWLSDEGYRTGLFGKYLNGYPWDRGPYVPPGWSRFVGKSNRDQGQTYYGYEEIDQGVPLFPGEGPDAYATDHFADLTISFLRTVPVGQPYFAMYTPSAPHPPWVPAPRDVGAFAGTSVPTPSQRLLNDVRGKPSYIRERAWITAVKAVKYREERRHERATLLAVDDAVRRIVATVAARGELDRTVIVFLTDNGYAFGEHRWHGKKCAYEPCIRTPFAVLAPWDGPATVSQLVSNVDLAATIADLAGVQPGLPQDGQSLAALLGAPDPAPPPDPSRPVLIEWAGDREVPPWRGVRTPDLVYIENADGTVELYDLGGQLGPPDPDEVRNLAGVGRFVAVQASLARTLVRLSSQGEGAG
jgi:N-acetylglucosamine-6-sulfatase